jgi:hypothetical protein
MVLCIEQPSDHLLGFLSRRVESITRAMFDVSLPSFLSSLTPSRSFEMTLRAHSTTQPASLKPF